MHSAPLRTGAFAVVVAILGACTATPAETPDPAAIPSGSLVAERVDPGGPVVEVGAAQTLDLGWRYSVYPAGREWCVQLETMAATDVGCGPGAPAGDAAFSLVARDEVRADGTSAVHGIVSPDTATVWMIGGEAGEERAPATLMSLEDAGLDAVAFVGFAPADVELTHLQAVAASGDVLETYELP